MEMNVMPSAQKSSHQNFELNCSVHNIQIENGRQEVSLQYTCVS